MRNSIKLPKKLALKKVKISLLSSKQLMNLIGGENATNGCGSSGCGGDDGTKPTIH
ncbi:MAG TPA: TIGR04149 family rSAM-modified RiPP [Nitrosopumilaceae archaeon]|jgi:natural product precursor|nr:TIGR04149 family rSAM-modified RiPP [Nitrosopumilaceae archaeon]